MTKKKKIKVWAIVFKHVRYFIETADYVSDCDYDAPSNAMAIYDTKKQAQEMWRYMHRKDDYTILPCEITYTLPSKKK